MWIRSIFKSLLDFSMYPCYIEKIIKMWYWDLSYFSIKGDTSCNLIHAASDNDKYI